MIGGILIEGERGLWAPLATPMVRGELLLKNRYNRWLRLLTKLLTGPDLHCLETLHFGDFRKIF